MGGSCLAGATSSDPIITEVVGGSDVVCRPIDLNLRVKTGPGFATPCIVRGITRLTPEQVAALPANVRP